MSGKILEEACGATCAFAGAVPVVCTLAKGHDAPHVDQRQNLAWRDAPKEYTPDEFVAAQMHELAKRDESEHARALKLRERAEDYDRVQGALARAHGWALEEARAWSMFASAATQAAWPEDAAITADDLLKEWRKRFGNAAARERAVMADAVIALSVEPPQ